MRTVGEFFTVYEWLVLAVGIVTSQPVFGALARAYRRFERTRPVEQRHRLRRRAAAAGDAYLAVLLAYCLALIAANAYSPFIYFQF